MSRYSFPHTAQLTPSGEPSFDTSGDTSRLITVFAGVLSSAFPFILFLSPVLCMKRELLKGSKVVPKSRLWRKGASGRRGKSCGSGILKTCLRGEFDDWSDDARRLFAPRSGRDGTTWLFTGGPDPLLHGVQVTSRDKSKSESLCVSWAGE